jgi:Uma2 family endonuclease
MPTATLPPPTPRGRPAAAAPLAPAVSAGPVRRFTIAEYEQLVEQGMLGERDPYHLLNGEIRLKMPVNDPHTSTASKLEKRFWRLITNDQHVWVEKPISFPNSNSQPQPDIAIVLGPETRYDAGKPHAADVLLVVEVSDTSLASDRGEMLELYAGGKVPEYWIVNLIDGAIEVYTNPRGGKKPGYKAKAEYRAGDSVPVVLGGKTVGQIAVSDILPGGN